MPRFLFRLWERWFGEPVRKVEAESLAYRMSEAARRPDYRTITVLLTAAVCLTGQNYFAAPEHLEPIAGPAAGLVAGPAAEATVRRTLLEWNADQASILTWAGLTAVVCYAVIPGLVIRWGFGGRLTDFGFGVRGVAADWPVYLAFAAVMAPLVWMCSGSERFQAVYPFYRVNSPAEVGGTFLRWELVYALQFVGLEFFFRGFLVHGTKHRFGVYAVFVMAVPYCMIHFHKPLAECVGSIVAGVALGLVSLATRSIWPGAVLHIFVAWGMDLSCLLRRGMLG
ncbi:MAG: CPBP family intramembrane metalloprotease [Gemmataceae bacterium]|nr:CPBP family intramembrane metalloprotease [Gemmataceae bacterium]